MPKETPTFAVIGAGNVGKAMAAHLSLLGKATSQPNRKEYSSLKETTKKAYASNEGVRRSSNYI